jgi:thioredoxin reductase (NADPH)
VGAILARSGDPTTSFVYVEEGEVEVVNPYTNEGHLLEALGLMMIGLAKNGAGTWDIAMNVDIDSNRL